MKVEYQFTEEQKFSLSLLIDARDRTFEELKSAYCGERTGTNYEYIKSLNERLMLIASQMTEIYMVTPMRCLMTKEDFENLRKRTKYDDELINIQNQISAGGHLKLLHSNLDLHSEN